MVGTGNCRFVATKLGTARRPGLKRTEPGAWKDAMTLAVPASSSIVWTADCSSTVELCRCDGPRTGVLRPPACFTSRHQKAPVAEFDLSVPANKLALYECLLRSGTAFDIYYWINLSDLAQLWPRIHLERGMRAEWSRALRALGFSAATG